MNVTDLHEYQKRLANFIAKHPRSIISVDMGLGKTAAVLAWLDWYVKKMYLAKTESATRYYTRMPFLVIIIAPKRVAENNWLQEAEKWGLAELYTRMTICAGNAKKRGLSWSDDTKPIKICSRDNYKDFAGAKADVLILDELTSYKSPDAGRSKAVQSIEAPIKVGLTGTFLANGAIDIYGQAAAVGLGFDNLNFYAWRATYFRDALAGSGLQFHKWKLSIPLEAVLKPIRENIFTLTARDYLQIPEVSHITHKVEVGEEVRKAIEELDAFLAMELNGETMTFDENQKFAKLQTLCDGFVYDEYGKSKRGKRSEKLEAVADFVADCVDAGEHVLLFYAFREEREWLYDLLKARKVRTYDVKNPNFMKYWDEGLIDCLIAHPASAGHGLNLQHGGRTIVWSTLTYNYELFAQGNARLARQGQRQNVQIHFFVADKTCEENALRALIRKNEEQNHFLNLTKQ